MLRIVRGERLDGLLDAMLGAMERTPLEPPACELVVVQGRGLDRWISQQAALRRGGWGFAETLYPRPFLLRAVAAVCDGRVPARRMEDGWMRMELELAIAARLPSLIEDPRFAPVAAAMRDPTARASLDDAALEIAPAIAEVLDRCAQHRVEMVAGWVRGGAELREGDDEAWLAELWRCVAASLAPSRMVVDRERFLERCREDRGVPPGLPPRMSIFGVSTLAPAFLELLAALAQRVDITVYALDPCPGAPHPLVAAWGIEAIEFEGLASTLSARGAAQLERIGAAAHASTGTLALLKARLRGQAPSAGGMVARVNAAADAVMSSAASAASAEGAGTSDAQDDSLQLLPCRGVLQEVERVHDAIAALLERDPTLQPREIAILTPDLPRYGPIVEAVFGARRDDAGRPTVPFTVADGDRGSSDSAETLARIVKVALGRCERREVLDLLSMGAVGDAFDIGPGEFERLRLWSEQAEVRWGLDAAHRALHGRPDETIGTWQWGLDRLRLGAVMADGATGAMGDAEPVAPVAAVEEGDRALLESLGAFIDGLGEVAHRVGNSRPIARAGLRADARSNARAIARADAHANASTDARARASEDARAGGALPQDDDDWLEVIERIAQRVIGGVRSDVEYEARPRTASPALAEIRARLGEIREAAMAAGFTAPHRVHARTAMAFIMERLRAEHPGRALLAAGVTVAALQPMRSIPFRVIALVGMADGVIPRRVAPPGFDLVARRRREGDRDARLDDRQVMLETVMAASQALLICWPGVDPASGHELPPSVLVSELLDAMPEVKPSAADAVPASAQCAAPARPLAAPSGEGRVEAVADGSTALPAEIAMVTLDELERFWNSPAAAYLAARRISIERHEREREQEDPIDREYEKAIRRDLLGICGCSRRTAGAERREVSDRALAGRGLLPRGATGPTLAAELRAQSRAWLELAESLTRKLGAADGLRASACPISLELEIDRALAPACHARGVRLDGTIPILPGIGPFILLERGTGGTHPAMLRGYLRLLALTVANAMNGEAPGAAKRARAAVHASIPLSGLLLLGMKSDGKGSERELDLDARLVLPPAPEQARALLAEFAALALHGVRTPLPFMPTVGLIYGHHCTKRSPTPDQALSLSREEFFDEGSRGAPSGDGLNEAVRTLFGPERFFDASLAPSFETLAKRLAVPVMLAMKSGLTGRTLMTRGEGAAGKGDTSGGAGRGRRGSRGKGARS